MTILFFSKEAISPYRGGVERFSLVLGRRFAQDGHKVIYLSHIHGKGECAEVEGQRYLEDGSGFDTPANISALRSMIVDDGIDILFNQQADNIECTRLLDKARHGTSARVVSVLHFAPEHLLRIFRASVGEIFSSAMPWRDQIGYVLRNTSVRQWQMRRLLRHTYSSVYTASDAIVLVSERFRDDYMQMAGIPDGCKICAISNPYTGGCFDGDPKLSVGGTCPSHPNRVAGLRSQSQSAFPVDGVPLAVKVVPQVSESVSQQDVWPVVPWADKRKEVLFVGRMEFQQKRPDLLLRIWQRVQDDFPDWVLTVVGAGRYEQPMHKLIESRHLQRVTMVGRADPDVYYRRSSILCVTSNTEAFSLSIVEGSRQRVVPIAFDSYAAAHDVIEPGKSGYLIPPFDLDVYADRLRLLMRDEALRHQMGDCARQHSMRFDMERILPQWYRLFDSLLA